MCRDKMSIKVSILTVAITILSMSFLSYSPKAFAKELCSVYRLSGGDRYETSSVISRDGWEESEYIVLAVGEGDKKFADAFAGTPLAYTLGAPLLVNDRAILNTYVQKEIARLHARKAILLGGPEGITSEVEQKLNDLDIETERIWGRDRYETSLKIAEKVWTITPFSKVFITTGEKFQYSMMIAPYASRNNIPILFNAKDSLEEDVKKAIIKWGIDEVHIIGGEDIISEIVENELESMGVKVKRTGGQDIIKTNINVIRRYDMGTNGIGVARDDIFADGLAGASFAALKDIPILFTHSTCPDSQIQDFLNKYEFESAYIFGGINAISDNIIDLIKKQKPRSPCGGILAKNAFNDDEKKVAFLTFDDGPSKNVTPAILDILKDFDIKATFFVVGRMAKGNGEVVKRAFEEGHSIANHSYSHEYSYLYRNTNNFMKEINMCDRILKDILGEDFNAKLFRFPGGAFGNKYSGYKSQLKSSGYEYINWNALTGDAEGYNISAERLIKRLKDSVSGKDHVVILMHDLGSKKTTVEALPYIIEYLISEGYEFSKLI